MADTKEIINCPACGKIMKKVFIPGEGINIDICMDGCGGIFFDNREFDKFNEENEDISAIIENYKGNTYTQVNDNTQRTCPVCGMKMVQNTSSVKKEVTIDECYGCGGKFLDYGELEKIRDEFKNDKERSQAAINYLYNNVGQEIKELNYKHEQNIHNRTLTQKLFYKILGS